MHANGNVEVNFRLDTVNISSTVVSVGYGLFVCDIGALVCLVGLVLALRSRPRA